MTIATAEDLAHFQGLPAVPSGMEDTYALAVELGVGLAQDETRQRLEYVEEEGVTIAGTGAGVVLLPELPVIEVTEVAVKDHPDDVLTVLDADVDFVLAPGDDGRLATLLRLGGARWPGLTGSIIVSYSHGYGTGDYGPPVPAGLKAVVLRMAARGIANPAGLTQETVGRWTGSFGSAGGLGLTAADKIALSGYGPGRRH